jgi:hypothetical protein
MFLPPAPRVIARNPQATAGESWAKRRVAWRVMARDSQITAGEPWEQRPVARRRDPVTILR